MESTVALYFNTYATYSERKKNGKIKSSTVNRSIGKRTSEQQCKVVKEN